MAIFVAVLVAIFVAVLVAIFVAVLVAVIVDPLVGRGGVRRLAAAAKPKGERQHGQDGQKY